MLETLSTAMDRMTEGGFTADLVATDDGLREMGSDTTYALADVEVVETVRFEGSTDPADEAILFSIAHPDGTPIGTYAASYGPQTEPADAAVIRRLTEHDG